MTPRCPECDGRLDRPGQFGCDEPVHPAPTPAQKVVWAIIDDLSDRRGLKQEWHAIDPDTRDEIRDVWTRLVEENTR